jgi:hypothetical protein
MPVINLLRSDSSDTFDGHTKGMDGAKAEIDSAEKTTVYMINYTSTTDGEEVTNHKWVTESELSPK